MKALLFVTLMFGFSILNAQNASTPSPDFEDSFDPTDSAAMSPENIQMRYWSIVGWVSPYLSSTPLIIYQKELRYRILENEFRIKVAATKIHPLVKLYCEAFGRRIIQVISENNGKDLRIYTLSYIVETPSMSLETLNGFQYDVLDGKFID